MDVRKCLVATAALLAVAFAFWCQHRKVEKLTRERDRYRTNTESLMGDVERFKVRDSLSAAKVRAMELSVEEFERFRAEDAELIRSLRARNRDLQSVSQAQTQMIIELRATARDTIIIRDSVKVPALVLHTGDAWYDFDGVLDGRAFEGKLSTRDSLLISETVQYRRFLGFLWKTSKVKNREVEAVSKNPHTEILGLDFVFIEK